MNKKFAITFWHHDLIIGLWLLFLLGFVSPSSAQNAHFSPMSDLDIEIHLLNAELSYLDQDPQQTLQWVSKLQHQRLAGDFRQRYDRLVVYLQQQGLVDKATDTATLTASPLNAHRPIWQSWDLNRGVVALLPLSGRYQLVGQQILDGILSALPDSVPFHSIDSSDYQGRSLALLDAALAYDPGLILGPVDAEHMQTLCAQDLPVPMIALNRSDQPSALNASNESACLSMSPASKWQLMPLLKSLPITQRGTSKASMEEDASLTVENTRNEPLNRVLVVVEKSKDIVPMVRQQLQTLPHIVLIEQQKQTLKQALGKGFNWHLGNWRLTELQRALQWPTSIMGSPRVRQDLAAVVFVGNHQQALRLVADAHYLLDDDHLDFSFYWLPTALPLVNQFDAKSLPWSAVYGLLPSHYWHAVSHYRSSGNIDKEKTGTLFAFGNDVMQWAWLNANQPKRDVPLDGQLGYIQIHPHRPWVDILPITKWLDKRP